MNINKIRQDFPILHQTVHNEPLIYLDNAASTQRPKQVIEAIKHYYEHDHANIHRGVHTLAGRATKKYEQARIKVAEFLGAKENQEIIFTRGTTHGINLAIRLLEPLIKKTDEIYTTKMDHHSVIVPMQELAKRTGAKLIFLPLTEEGEIDYEACTDAMTDKGKLLVTCHASNVLGVINDVKRLADLIHRYDGYIIVDGAQSVPHMPVDVQALDSDFYTFSGHKMLAPTGIGALYGKKNLLENCDPLEFGGEMIGIVEEFTSTWAELPYKFEAGTQNISGAIGLGAAIDYLQDIGLHNIQLYEHQLVDYLFDKLKQRNYLTIHGPLDANKHSGVVSFSVSGIHPHDLSTGLDLEGIAIRAGHHCAQPLMRWLDVSATARASFYFYNTFQEIDHFVTSLDAVKEFFDHGII